MLLQSLRYDNRVTRGNDRDWRTPLLTCRICMISRNLPLPRPRRAPHSAEFARPGNLRCSPRAAAFRLWVKRALFVIALGLLGQYAYSLLG